MTQAILILALAASFAVVLAMIWPNLKKGL